MLTFFSGTNRQQARAALEEAVANVAKKGTSTVRITDAHSLADLAAALRSGGMFDTKRVVILDSVLTSEDMREMLLDSLETIARSDDQYFLLEEKPDAATRKQIEKAATKSEKFDAAKKADGGASIFALAAALKRGDKKALWIGLQRELHSGKSPEAVHGVLFWGAKDMFMKGGGERGARLLAALAELPHESRRRGEELDYALERFVLSMA